MKKLNDFNKMLRNLFPRKINKDNKWKSLNEEEKKNSLKLKEIKWIK